MALSKKTVDIVKATAPLVAENALKITSIFYQKMFTNNPEVLAFFNKTHQRGGKQSRALADSVVAYASNIDNLAVLGPLVERIAHRHVALSVTPEMYSIVHKNLMAAIPEVLGSAVTPEIGAAWSEAVLALASICIEKEKELYALNAKRSGGWTHEKEFIVSRKDPAAAESVLLEFKASDGKDAKIDFKPGQYLTLRVPGAGSLVAPRHYTVTSPPGVAYLQCTTKRVDHGVLSNFAHDNLKVGDKVLLGAPCGVFVPSSMSNAAVLISAGIGITPMLSFARALGKGKVLAALHVDRSPAHHAFRKEFQDIVGANKVNVAYTDKAGRPDLAKEADKLIAKAGKKADYYVCGPVTFMDDMIHELRAKGVEHTYYEIFGTGTIETNMEALQHPERGQVAV